MVRTILGRAIRILDCKDIRNTQDVVEKHSCCPIFPSSLATLSSSQTSKPALAEKEVILREFGQ